MLRATLVIDIENPASQRVAVRCGYIREGVLRSVHLKAGRRIDAELWSRLPTTPTARNRSICASISADGATVRLTA